MFQDYLYVTGLAFRDIGHERVLSLCMVCSLGAIFTPIIILLGLQQGIIGNMLDTLNSDPASRLVRPKFIMQSPIPEEKLESIKQAGGVFISSETSHLLLEIEGMKDSVNVVPSSLEDPFVVHAKPLNTDEYNWVLISESLSRKLDKKAGDDLTLMLNRTTDSRSPEEVPFQTKIIGVVAHSMMPDLKVYLASDVFNDIYHWRKGYAAPKLGLLGDRSHRFSPEYDGVATGFALKSPKDVEFRQILAGRLPFSAMPVKYEQLDAHNVDTQWYLWRTINSTVTLSDIEVLENTLLNHGYAPKLVPFVNNVELKLASSDHDYKWRILTLETTHSPKWELNSPPRFYISPEDVLLEGKQDVVLRSGVMNVETTIPVILEASNMVPPGFVVTSHHFAGLIRSAQRVGASYDPTSYSFVLNSVDQVRYFRVYSESIEHLDSLVNRVRSVGFELGVNALKEPVSRINEVLRIRTLSDYMQRIYLLIAAISGVSTFFAVSASVYATVQRRKRDLAYLNMLGVNKSTIVFFPFVKSLILIIGGIIIAFIAYWIFGYLASHWFVDLLGETESLTRLKIEYVIGLIAIILLLGGLSSLTAGSLVNKIDPRRYTNE